MRIPTVSGHYYGKGLYYTHQSETLSPNPQTRFQISDKSTSEIQLYKAESSPKSPNRTPQLEIVNPRPHRKLAECPR